jgi:hypothetical protein
MKVLDPSVMVILQETELAFAALASIVLLELHLAPFVNLALVFPPSTSQP